MHVIFPSKELGFDLFDFHREHNHVIHVAGDGDDEQDDEQCRFHGLSPYSYRHRIQRWDSLG
jgi:hypothetical protein